VRVFYEPSFLVTLVHAMNTLEKGRRKREVVEKLILKENISI